MFKREPFFVALILFASIIWLSGCGDSKPEEPPITPAPENKEASAAVKQGGNPPSILSNPYNEPDQPSKRKKK